jgi:hypothetical protein
MRKNVIYKMKTNMKEGLPLRLVNSHRTKLAHKGNCFLANVNGKPLLSEMNLMRGIKATLLTPLHVMISASMTRIMKRRTIRHVPLHNLTDGSRLRNNITGAPILNDTLCEGMPLTSKVLRNSEGYVFATSMSSAKSALRKFFFF